MHRRNRILILVLVVSLPLAVVADLAISAATEGDPDPGSCCFTNPRFNGVCQIDPAGEETCASILAYLNSPNSTGKSYCGATPLRGGWAEVSCAEQDAGSAASAPARDPADAANLAGDGAL